MSSEVETSRCESFTAALRDSSTSLGMTERLFAALAVYHDATPRLAAINMAIDEALLENANVPIIRFYQWDHPALSFGYFGRFADVAQQKRDLVRRWTGGGMVFHGEDLTYAIVIPSSDPAFQESSMSIYEKVHRVLCNALLENDERAELVTETTLNAQRSTPNAQFADACFANPVRADVILNGQKVAGAAQRRTRRGLLHQGSIQNVAVGNGLAERFARGLASKIDNREIENAIVRRAEEIARKKYGTEAWLRKR
jgi:lipoyl(octanoyl) transferase